jgi:DNA-binding LytR/AlgR family response regulator
MYLLITNLVTVNLLHNYSGILIPLYAIMKNTLTTPHPEQVAYKDLYARLLITLFGAHYIVSFGEPESFFELLFIWDYIRSLLYSWAIAFIIVSLIRWITWKLDRKYEWQQKPVVRLLLQFLFGIITLSLIAFLLAAVYFALHQKNILKTEYLAFDFPVILLMLMITNLYYFVYYVLVKWKSNNDGASDRSYRNVIIIQQSAKNIPIQVADISYFYRANDVNFLRTIDGNDHIVNDTLDQIEQSLEPTRFFRVNRQFITSYNTWQRFEIIENDKLELFVKPSFKERILISQKKAPDFRKWIEK